MNVPQVNNAVPASASEPVARRVEDEPETSCVRSFECPDQAQGWQVGGPGAEERETMLTVLIVSDLEAALVGGAMLGMELTQPH